MGLIELVILVASLVVIVVLLVIGVGGFVRGLRTGLREDAPAYRPLRSTLFRTVLVTLLVLFLLVAAVINRGQREEQWPASEGITKLDRTVARGVPWIDQEAYDAIHDALLGAGDTSGGGGGQLNYRVPGMLAASDFPSDAQARVKTRGWDVGTAVMYGEERQYVAWRTTPSKAIYIHWYPVAWYTQLWQYLMIVAFTAALLSPFAAVAAWYLNRRIVKPVQQVADASVVIAGGGTPIRVPEKAPLELSVLAQSFNQMADKLKKAQETERDFLMSVGHELKTPLTAIDGYAELLADEAVDPKRAADVLSAESSRLRRLIADLLDLARIGRSEFHVVQEPVDLAQTAREVVTRYENLATTLGVGLEADAPEGASARGDAGRLLQVASNLVENALRATRAGDQVTVAVKPGLLSVRDTGPGLTDEDERHAFERFYLHRKYAEGPEVGTGLGLAIVKDLTEAMGGRVEVASAPEAGTTFVVSLPALDKTT